MNADDFETLSTVLNKRSGLALTKDKSYLLESRLMRVVRQRRFNDIPQLAAAIRGKDESLIAEVVEVMTTSETLFFPEKREGSHPEQPGESSSTRMRRPRPTPRLPID